MNRFLSGSPSSCRLPEIVFLFLFLGFVLPSGVGFFKTPSLPNLDLPRISLILFNVVAMLVFLTGSEKGGLRSLFNAAPMMQLMLLIVSFFGISNSIANGFWSISWALGDCVQIWIAAFFAIALCKNDHEWVCLTQVISLLFFVVAAFAWIEWVTQERLFTIRNFWESHMLQHALDLRRSYRLSIGPYPNNHYLGLVLIATSGPMLMSPYRLLASIVFAGGIFSVGFVAGFVAAGAMFLLVFLIKRDWKAFVVCVLYALALAFILIDGGVAKTQGSQPYSHVFSDNKNRGSVQSRYKTLGQTLSSTWEHVPLSGFGVGVLEDSRVKTTVDFAPLNTDVGGIFRLAIEYGYLVFTLVLGSLVISGWRGIRSHDANCQGAAISIIGFLIAIFSSQILQALPIVLMLCGFVEYKIKNLNNTLKP